MSVASASTLRAMHRHLVCDAVIGAVAVRDAMVQRRRCSDDEIGPRAVVESASPSFVGRVPSTKRSSSELPDVNRRSDAHPFGVPPTTMMRRTPACPHARTIVRTAAWLLLPPQTSQCSRWTVTMRRSSA